MVTLRLRSRCVWHEKWPSLLFTAIFCDFVCDSKIASDCGCDALVYSGVKGGGVAKWATFLATTMFNESAFSLLQERFRPGVQCSPWDVPAECAISW